MPDYFILHPANAQPTASELCTWIKDKGLDIGHGTSTGDHRFKGVVRWGSEAQMRFKPNMVIQFLAGIKNATDKRAALLKLREAGIRTPDIWIIQDGQMVGEGWTWPGIYLVRRREHQGGTDVIPCVQKADLTHAFADRRADHVTRYIPKVEECRVHVWDDTVIKISQKIRTDNSKPYSPFVWNFEHGFTFRYREERLPATVRYLAIQAVEALGLTFGAVDIILGEDGRWYVLEVNTAPAGRVDSTVEAYGKKILEAFQAA